MSWRKSWTIFWLKYINKTTTAKHSHRSIQIDKRTT